MTDTILKIKPIAKTIVDTYKDDHILITKHLENLNSDMVLGIKNEFDRKRETLILLNGKIYYISSNMVEFVEVNKKKSGGYWCCFSKN